MYLSYPVPFSPRSLYFSHHSMSISSCRYDGLRIKSERAEAEVQRLQVIEATFRRMEQQVTEADKAHRQREHSLEMLQMDKAYLSKQVFFMRNVDLPLIALFRMHSSIRCIDFQVEFMEEQQRKLKGDLEMREQQVQELQKTRNDSYEKLMEAENSRGRHDEARLHKELAQLQVGSN